MKLQCLQLHNMQSRLTVILANAFSIIIILALMIAPRPALSRISSSTKHLDRYLNAKLKKENIQPSKATNDEEFLRRIRLDLTGKIPTPEEVSGFSNGGRSRRENKINQLLNSEAYLDYWSRIWTDWLIGRDQNQQNVRQGLQNWVQKEIESNTSYDQFVKKLITPTGDTRQNGAGYYIRRYNTSPINLTSHLSRLFLGLPMQCAQCHDHKTEAWYQEDYYNLAAFLTSVRSEAIYEKDQRGNERIVAYHITDVPEGSIRMPGKSRPSQPRLLDGTEYNGSPLQRRVVLANWMTNAKNPYFSQAIVNRIWAQLMGKGFVEPLDGFGEEHPPSHPKLLDWLAEDFEIHGYDLKHLMRTILNTDAYQRTSKTNKSNKDDNRFFSHAYIKPLSAEQFFYSMLEATGFERLQKRRDKSRLESMKRDYLSRFLYLLDNGEMEEIEAFNGTVPQALMMINGPLVNDSADHKTRGSYLNYVLKKNRRTMDRINDIYLTVLSRQPTGKEIRYFDQYLQKSLYRDKDLAYEDLYWSLLNSAEFSLNH